MRCVRRLGFLAAVEVLICCAGVLVGIVSASAAIVGGSYITPVVAYPGFSSVAYQTYSGVDDCSNATNAAPDTLTGPYNCPSGGMHYAFKVPSTWVGQPGALNYDCANGTTGTANSNTVGAYFGVNSSGVVAGNYGVTSVSCYGKGGITAIEFDAKNPATGQWVVAFAIGPKAPGGQSSWGAWLSATYVPPAAWCQPADLSMAVGSYAGGMLAVRFHWLNAAVPSAGWSVYAPDPGSATGTPALTVTSSATVDGQPGYYYATASVASLATMTARIVVAANAGGQPGCFVSITLSGNAISQTDPNQGVGDSTDPVTNTDCGAWWHIKCHFTAALSWAFSPANLSGDLSGFVTGLQGKAPWNYILAGPQTIGSVVQSVNNGIPNNAELGHDATWTLPTDNAGGSSSFFGIDPYQAFICAAPPGGVSPSAGNEDCTQGKAPAVAQFQGVMQLGVIIAFTWACYHRAKRVIGDSGPNDPSQSDVTGDYDTMTPDQIGAESDLFMADWTDPSTGEIHGKGS